jgi:hypothetical protein
LGRFEAEVSPYIGSCCAMILGRMPTVPPTSVGDKPPTVGFLPRRTGLVDATQFLRHLAGNLPRRPIVPARSVPFPGDHLPRGIGPSFYLRAGDWRPAILPPFPPSFAFAVAWAETVGRCLPQQVGPEVAVRSRANHDDPMTKVVDPDMPGDPRRRSGPQSSAPIALIFFAVNCKNEACTREM